MADIIQFPNNKKDWDARAERRRARRAYWNGLRQRTIEGQPIEFPADIRHTPIYKEIPKLPTNQRHNMKSNKQRYNDILGKSVKTSGGGNNNGGGWGLSIIMTIIIMMVIIALKILGKGMAGNDDLNIGIGYPLPDAEEIQKHFR